jgi:hypothetical protein
MTEAQGVTTAALSGVVTDSAGGVPVANANVVAVHVPSGTQYRARTRASGAFTLPNLRIGGPYRVTVTSLGWQPRAEEDVFLTLGETRRLDFRMVRAVQQLATTRITGTPSEATRTGAATTMTNELVIALPSVKRSTRDLTRLDPRSDGNFSFGGRNWLFNNVTLDGSYFNNSFGLDDPAPGGQTNAEPVPFDAVDQVRVSIAPFDVRQGGFTGANVNTVTRSGTNQFRGSLYSFFRSDALQGNEVSGSKVVANPDLTYRQSGFSLSGPLARDKLFFFVNAELERNDDPGTNFVASRGTPGFGISRVRADTMDLIRTRLKQVYNYETGPYEGYVSETDNDKLIARLDWNANDRNNLSFRFNYLDASRDLPPHPFVLSFNNTGRGPNATSLPFRNSGYTINNKLQSYALEWNARSSGMANRFFASYNRFRDSRTPFSEDFPTIEIGNLGVTYTTAGHEPFSIHNILDQDVLQLTNNLSLFFGNHVATVGANYETFSFFNSFNIFRHGLFHLAGIGSTYSSVVEFLNATSPTNPNRVNFRGMIGSGPFKGEDIDVGQVSVYAQDEWLATPRLTLTYGLRVDVPTYFTDPVDNPFSRGLTALDENRRPEVVDQSKLPGTTIMWSPRLGFNWDMQGNRQTIVRGGTGIFTGRVPFVWIGNVISNPGANPNLYPATGAPQRPTSYGSSLQQSFDVNAMSEDFKFPQVWTTSLGVDRQLGGNVTATLDVMYGKDLNSVFMRNADLRAPVRTLPDGRPYFSGPNGPELNADFGAGIYVIDNTDEGYSFNITGQLRKAFSNNASAGIGYSHTRARNNLKSTEIASVLWQNQPVQGDPNNPELSYSEFGQRHRFVGDALYTKSWSRSARTQFGIFAEFAEGNRFSGAGGNRYSFIYSGDVNGDGQGGNDLIFIPRSQSDIVLVPFTDAAGRTFSAQEQWTLLNAFIEQDAYLSAHRGQIAERFGAVNPWYSTVDVRILQDLSLAVGAKQHTMQITFDLMNAANLLNSDWGVRKVASASATSPLRLAGFNTAGAPTFNFTGPSATYIDDPDVLSRWRAQLGVRYFFQ